MQPTQKEYREELIALAVELLGDVLLLDCLLERLNHDHAWDGVVVDTLLDKLNDFLSQNAQEVTFLTECLLAQRQEASHSSRVKA